ncbi:hypothetical protein [Halovivax gelatinilyticus]|uniref:hypothetical protein n=1 Tax=Halovivax gelatinilyticus TaxID=2961597 RepID=UPI0020CA65D2|nr:hypothetical protein [Halovivax gelatinilyticus]
MDERTAARSIDPERAPGFERPLTRRRFLVAGGCLGLAGAASSRIPLRGIDRPVGDGSTDVVERPTVVVFNTGDGSVTVIDVETDEAIATVPIGLTASFPSNQFSPRLVETADDLLWCNVDDGVRAVSIGSLEPATGLETGSGANWQELTPDGTYLVVSAREPIHRQYRIDADPTAERFGEVTGEIDRRPEGGRDEHDGPGPCDVTVHPNGRYAYVPDLYGDTLTVVDVESFEIDAQIDVEPTDDGEPPAPYMATAAWDGEHLLVENDGGESGSESIWDVTDPAAPVEVARLGPDDGLGDSPLTSEIGPDADVGYVFTPGTDDVSVVDLAARTVVDRLDLGGSAFTGTWDPAREKLYVPVQTTDTVAVIDAGTRTVVTTIEVGDAPYGATAARLRPADRVIEGVRSSNGRSLEYETTFCRVECACGTDC